MATGAPKMEMKYMHLKEGTSGVPSKVGMAKTGRCGGKVGCGCPGRSNVRAEAVGRKAGLALKEKRSCASSHWGKRCLYLQRRGGPVRPSRCLSSTSSPSSCATQLDAAARPAPSLAKLRCHSLEAQRRKPDQRVGLGKPSPSPATAG